MRGLAHHSIAVFITTFFANFRELRYGEVRRIPLLRTCVNKGKKEGRVRLDWSDAAGTEPAT